MRSLRRDFKSGKRGFTIIELLVATGVTALLVGIMVTIISSVLAGWNRSAGTLETGSQSRLILDQLSQDLQGVIMRRDSNVWLAATIQATGGSAGVPGEIWTSTKPADATSLVIPTLADNKGISDYRFGQAGVWLRMITNVSDTNSGTLDKISAPRAVAYQIVRMPVRPGSDEIRFQFFRSEVRPGSSIAAEAVRSTFGQGYDLFKTGPDSYNTPSGTNSGDGDPGCIRRPTEAQLLGNNVIDFGVRIYERNAAGMDELKFPLTTGTLGYAAAMDNTSKPEPMGVTYVAGYPQVVEVMVRVLSSEGVRLIEAFEQGNVTRPPEYSSDGAYWWGLAEANSQVFTRRIEVKAKSL